MGDTTQVAQNKYDTLFNNVRGQTKYVEEPSDTAYVDTSEAVTTDVVFKDLDMVSMYRNMGDFLSADALLKESEEYDLLGKSLGAGLSADDWA